MADAAYCQIPAEDVARAHADEELYFAFVHRNTAPNSLWRHSPTGKHVSYFIRNDSAAKSVDGAVFCYVGLVKQLDCVRLPPAVVVPDGYADFGTQEKTIYQPVVENVIYCDIPDEHVALAQTDSDLQFAFMHRKHVPRFTWKHPASSRHISMFVEDAASAKKIYNDVFNYIGLFGRSNAHALILDRMAAAVLGHVVENCQLANEINSQMQCRFCGCLASARGSRGTCSRTDPRARRGSPFLAEWRQCGVARPAWCGKISARYNRSLRQRRRPQHPTPFLRRAASFQNWRLFPESANNHLTRHILNSAHR